MTTLKFKEHGLEIPFEGGRDEEKTAKLMVKDLLTLPLMKAICVEDVERLINGDKKHLMIYEFAPPFNPDELKKLLKRSKGVFYAIYADFDGFFNMHLCDLIADSIQSACDNCYCYGAPIDSKEGSIPIQSGNVKVVALI